MKRLHRLLPAALALLIGSACADVVQLDQNAVLYAPAYQRGVNYGSFRGAPGKTPVTTGSDGRAPAGGPA